MYQIDQFSSLAEAFFSLADSQPEKTIYCQAKVQEDGTRLWQETSNKTCASRVRSIAAYLRSLGVSKGDRVAVLSNTRPEWLESDISIVSCGAVSVSVYQSLPADDIAYILYDSGARIVFAENQEQVDKLLEINSKLSAIPATEDREATEAEIKLERIITFEKVSDSELVISLDDIIKGNEECSEIENISLEDTACFVYTSGTTGPPKGVVQTHGNHLANIRQSLISGLSDDDSSIMVFLPLAHSFAKLMGYLGFLTPASICFPAIEDEKSSKWRPESITRDIRESGASVFPVVPRILEKMQQGVIAKSRSGGLKSFLIRLALSSAKEVYSAKVSSKQPGMLSQVIHSGTASLREKIKQVLFGPNFKFAISGGAKLPTSVSEFFDSLGLEILEGYGLTETCVATNVNPPGRKIIGTVGPVLADDIEVRIESDGEILFRGPNISKGYHNRPTATSEAWEQDGWFRTGDLGELTSEGYLKIVGRKKDLIATAGGKKIAPSGIEEALVGLPLVSQAVLVGEGKPYLSALITLDESQAKAWAKENSVPESEIYQSQKVKDKVLEQIETVNRDLPSFETVKRIAIVDEEFSLENGLLTPSLKIKRSLVEKRFKSKIDSIYSG